MSEILSAMPINSSTNDDNTQQPMIALYYCYPPLGIPSPQPHTEFHTVTCTELKLGGRIRVSVEGINGVLSGREGDLREYEFRLRRELLLLSRDSNSISGDGAQDGVSRDVLCTDDNYEEATSKWLDIKYCHLRTDVPVEKQLFDSLSVKVTREVVSLFDFSAPSIGGKQKNGRRCRQRRKQKRKHKKQELSDAATAGQGEDQNQAVNDVTNASENNDNNTTTAEDDGVGSAFTIQDWEKYTPAQHLSPKDWNDRLMELSLSYDDKDDTTIQPFQQPPSPSISIAKESDVILLDARNIYETRVGHFAVPNLPTFFPNTRKFSSLPMALNTKEAAEALAGKKVFMYCTGGVRCERAGSYLRALSESNAGAWKDKQQPKGIYQLHGGIQKYLEAYGEPLRDSSKSESDVATQNANSSTCLYRGRNFVFDPRRTDPIVGNGITKLCDDANDDRVSLVGQCIKCSCPHDDYDNGHAPSEGKEARCCRCRVLVLVCNDCRRKVRSWGEETHPDAVDCEVTDLFCGQEGTKCIDEGNAADNVGTTWF